MSMSMKYAMKKKARMACGGKMADGGMVDDEEMPPESSGKGLSKEMGKKISDGFMSGEYAKGGEVSPDDDDLVMTIMKKRYAMGGEVSNDVGEGEDVDKMPNQFDYLVSHGDEQGDADYTGENSGDEDGNEALDMEDEDLVGSIMKSRKKKDRLPSPA